MMHLFCVIVERQTNCPYFFLFAQFFSVEAAVYRAATKRYRQN